MDWTVPKIWKDGECFIIGGGSSLLHDFGIPQEIINKVNDNIEHPSIFSSYLKPLHDKHVIGVNMAYKLGDWIDIVFFGDKGFFIKNRKEILNTPKLRVSCSPYLKHNHLIKYLGRERKRMTGLTVDPSKVVWNVNSGAAAINLAVHTGVKKIILLGFDMNTGKDDKTHWHSLYTPKSKESRNSAFARHLRGFPEIAEAADKIGVEIINTSMDSKIEVFKKLPINEVL